MSWWYLVPFWSYTLCSTPCKKTSHTNQWRCLQTGLDLILCICARVGFCHMLHSTILYWWICLPPEHPTFLFFLCLAIFLDSCFYFKFFSWFLKVISHLWWYWSVIINCSIQYSFVLSHPASLESSSLDLGWWLKVSAAWFNLPIQYLIFRRSRRW